ncbi:hypothetical protein LMOf6854_0038 [Listeria monocytogenes str. 1/2a F6854]|nr:hypothetical protein LMOf6854_0038 [Listeria monocytogenes str. 1/2a F6854] [Listeria monocytogenes serotype 1/2a str. F6854]
MLNISQYKKLVNLFFEFTENDKLFAKSSAYLEVIYEK